MVPLVAGAPTAVIPGDHLDYRDRLAAFAQVPVLSAAPVTDPTVAQVLSVTPPPAADPGRPPLGYRQDAFGPGCDRPASGLTDGGPLPKFSISGRCQAGRARFPELEQRIVAGLKVSSFHGFRP